MAEGNYRKGVKAAGIGVALLGSVLAGQAQATEGYFSHGFGARNSALAGAGVADSADAMSIAVNPAGLVDVGRQFNIGVTLFAPVREYTATGTAFVAPGTHGSARSLFGIPNIGYSRPIDADSTIGIALYGNGGMNTTFNDVINTSISCPGAPGVFCAGGTGVDLIQAFLSVAYARRFGNFSVGIAPILAIQVFDGNGLGAFAGISSNAANLTNRGDDYSVGGGIRIGGQFDVSETFRIAASYQSQIYMSEFDKYSGLFADGGDFDIPQNFTVGMAFDISPDVTIMADYKRIFYSDIGAIANSSSAPVPLGLPGGAGFGWNDINIFKLGVEWHQNDQWTWRAGYAYNENPITAADVTFNVLAPGVVMHHFTGGFSYTYNERDAFDFAFMYAPEATVNGPEVTPAGVTPGSNIELAMYQVSFTFGWTRKFP